MTRFLFFATLLSLALFSCGNNDNSTQPAARADSNTAMPIQPPPTPTEVGTGEDTATESLADLEKRRRIAPGNPSAAYDLAYEYAVQKNEKALKLADTLIRTNAPEVEKAYYSKATYYAAIGDTKKAVKNYDAAIAANYHFLDAYFDKGRMLFARKQYEQALKSFALGQKMSPGTADFYFWVAKTQEAMGNKADAKMNYERAYALDKGLTEAKAAADRL